MQTTTLSKKKHINKFQRKFYNLLDYLKNNGFLKTLYFVCHKLRAYLAGSELGWKLLFESNPFVSTGKTEDYPKYIEEVWTNLQNCKGLFTDKLEIKRKTFDDYIEKARYSRFSPYYEGNNSGREDHRTDKLLQHFISLEILEIKQDDVFVDVASNTSPIRHIVKELYNCKVYSLDLHYPAGINGELIGSDAANMPFEDKSISKMTLHCSYEHFANGADIRFLNECSRVLKKGGKVCIVPFYVLPEYSIRVDPLIEDSLAISDLEGAKKVYVRDYRVNYGRHYDSNQVVDRLINNAKDLKLTAIKICGLEQFAGELIYSQIALVIEKT